MERSTIYVYNSDTIVVAGTEVGTLYFFPVILELLNLTFIWYLIDQNPLSRLTFAWS